MKKPKMSFKTKSWEIKIFSEESINYKDAKVPKGWHIPDVKEIESFWSELSAEDKKLFFYKNMDYRGRFLTSETFLARPLFVGIDVNFGLVGLYNFFGSDGRVLAIRRKENREALLLFGNHCLLNDVPVGVRSVKKEVKQ